MPGNLRAEVRAVDAQERLVIALHSKHRTGQQQDVVLRQPLDKPLLIGDVGVFGPDEHAAFRRDLELPATAFQFSWIANAYGFAEADLEEMMAPREW